jgi:putative transposase
MDTTVAIPLASVFVTLFDREAMLDLARQTEAIERLKEIHPADFVRALVESASGDEKRTIASARRRYGRISGFEPEESSYYDHFNEGMVRLIEQLLRKAMKRAPASSRPLLSRLLDRAGLADMLALDASRFSLPSWARELYPSTDDQHGGVKITTLMSVLSPTIKKVIVTDARQHDRKVVNLPRWLKGLLILMDRGYCDRKLFAQIADRLGFFLTRLKKSHRPVIKRIRCGLDQRSLGQPFSNELPFEGEVDLDATFKMPGGAEREFRVVRLVVGSQMIKGKEEPVELLFVTNLSPEQFTVEQLATLYRFRWEIERLFAVCKGVGRLDHLLSGNQNVVEAFVYATLLVVVLGLLVCSWMRQRRPRCEPSAWRVTTLVLEWLPELARTAGHHSFWVTFAAFERALWREGVNPNPGRPYTATQYTFELGWQEACRCATH